MVYQHLVWPRGCARCVGYEAGRTKRLWPHGSLSGREDRLIRGPSCNVERAMREVTCGVEPGRRGHGSLFSVKGTGVGRGVHQMSSKAPSSSNSLQRFTGVGSGRQALPPKCGKTKKKPLCCRRKYHRVSSPCQSRQHLLGGSSRKPPANQSPGKLNKL